MNIIILQVRRVANPPHGFVDGQIELWHNPKCKGVEENE